MFLAALAVIMGAVFNVKGLKISHGIWIGAGLVLVASVIPDSQSSTSA